MGLSAEWGVPPISTIHPTTFPKWLLPRLEFKPAPPDFHSQCGRCLKSLGLTGLFSQCLSPGTVYPIHSGTGFETSMTLLSQQAWESHFASAPYIVVTTIAGLSAGWGVPLIPTIHPTTFWKSLLPRLGLESMPPDFCSQCSVGGDWRAHLGSTGLFSQCLSPCTVYPVHPGTDFETSMTLLSLQAI